MNVSLTPELNNTSRRGFQAGCITETVGDEESGQLPDGLRQDIQAGLDGEPTPDMPKEKKKAQQRRRQRQPQ